MKWIGQHIYDLISRFRSDVYLEDVSSGTIASGSNLGLDSNNKIVKATITRHTLIDSDTMTGASSSNVASAESIKAYVDGKTHLELGTSSSTALAGDTSIPSGNAVIDWTADQGGTNLHTGNYTDTNTQLALIDSDVMTGASSTNVASAESIKAYVDTRYTYTYTSFFGVSDIATNWAIPHLNGWIAYGNQWSTNTSVSATAIGTTISVGRDKAVTGFTIPFDGILVGFYASIRNNDANNQAAVGLFHQTGSTAWGTTATTNFALRAYSTGVYTGGSGTNYKGVCKAIDLSQSLAVSAGDLIIPAVLEATANKVYCNITMVIKTLIP